MTAYTSMFRAALVGALMTAASCSNGDENSQPASPSADGLQGFEQPEPGTVGAQVAVYEPVANKTQRFRLGLVGDQGRLISFGDITMHFAYLGTEADPISEPDESITAQGTYLLVAGQDPPVDTRGPRLIDPSEGFGVYGTEVTFDQPGFWTVRAVASIDGKDVEATATFVVLDKPNNPFPGEPAPLTDNRNLETPGIKPTSIDSRADADGSIPDPELHAITVANAVKLGKPLMVVVSTPTYCISRFCGPITDTIQRLAGIYGDDMSFIHAEVWNDYEGQALNKEAAEWIYRNPEADAAEPWVFLVGSDGIIIDRWDNVSTDAELEQAIQAAIAG